MDGAVDLVLDTTRKAYPSLDVPFHSRWRHFVINGDNRWAEIAEPDRLARSRGPRPGRIRSGDRQRAARCRRRSGVALPRSNNRISHRPFGRIGARQPCDVRGRRFLGRSAEPLARRCRGARKSCRCRPRARLAGLGCQSAGRDGRPRRPAAPPGPAGGLEAGNLRQPRHAAARRPVRPSCDAGRRRKAACARRS